MRPASLTTTAAGHIRDWIRGFNYLYISQNSVRVTFSVTETAFTNRYVGIYCGGILMGPPFQIPAGNLGPFNVVRFVPSTNRSIMLDDLGRWPLDVHGPSQLTWINEDEKGFSKTIRFAWTLGSTFSIANGQISATTENGDTSLTAISLTGCNRNSNMLADPLDPYAGTLYYRLTQSGGTTTLKFYAGNEDTYNDTTNLVASGTYVGSSGTMTLTEANSSGLGHDGLSTVTFAYTSDKDDYIQIEWPSEYQIHYSTSSLTFPRTPEATTAYQGKESFYFVTPQLSAGSYYAAIVPVVRGVAQSASVSVTSGLVINTYPTAPTITSVTGAAAAATVNWTVGEAGCTYTVYYSKIGGAVNYGSFALPAPITTALNATSQVLAAISGYPGKIRVAVFATKTGVQEKNGTEFEVEFDAAGAIVTARPNPATVKSYTATGLTLAVVALQPKAQEAVAPSAVDLFVKPIGTPLDFTTAQATAVPGTASATARYANLSYVVPATGWYHFAVRPKSSLGVYSENYTEVVAYLASTGTTGGVSSPIITTGI